jgi:toxin ParE1/3/4
MINKQTRRTELSQLARTDLDEIWSYINENNSQAADKLIRDFLQKFRMLAENPNLGRTQDKYFLNLRSFPFKNYIIFYVPTDYGIEIFRVIHSSRNIEGLFDEFFEGLK